MKASSGNTMRPVKTLEINGEPTTITTPQSGQQDSVFLMKSEVLEMIASAIQTLEVAYQEIESSHQIVSDSNLCNEED